MSEQEHLDRLLRKAMTAVPAPTLSPAFDKHLSRRLRSQGLNATSRLVLACYGTMALAVSVWTMRMASMDWSLIAIAVLVPLVLVATVQYRGLLRAR